jgi:hypothetical protein
MPAADDPNDDAPSETHRLIASYADRNVPAAEIAVRTGLSIHDVKQIIAHGRLSSPVAALEAPCASLEPDTTVEIPAAGQPRGGRRRRLAGSLGGVALTAGLAAAAVFALDSGDDAPVEPRTAPRPDAFGARSAQDDLELHDRSVHPPPGEE